MISHSLPFIPDFKSTAEETRQKRVTRSTSTMLSFSFTLTLLSTFITSISAHGYVQGILVAGKTYYSGYHPNFQYRNPIPIVAGWSDPEDISNGYISPSSYSHPDIICHLSATPGGTAVQVSAGSTLDLQWTTWPHSHHGPVLDYLARCPEDSCKDVDKTKLNFVKIAESGLMSWDAMPGKWASDVLISNNHSCIYTPSPPSTHCPFTNDTTQGPSPSLPPSLQAPTSSAMKSSPCTPPTNPVEHSTTLNVSTSKFSPLHPPKTSPQSTMASPPRNSITPMTRVSPSTSIANSPRTPFRGRSSGVALWRRREEIMRDFQRRVLYRVLLIILLILLLLLL